MAENQPASTPKSCTSCGLDVTNRKRTKDAQGRYFCEDCVAKAKAARAAANPPPQIKANNDAVASAGKAGGDDNAFLLDMGGSAVAMKGSVPCPECSRALTEGTVICTGCGYNLQTGKRLAVKVTKAKKVKEAGDGSGGGAEIMEDGFALSMIAIIVTVGLLGGAFFVPPLLLVGYLMLVILSLGTGIGAIVTAWRQDGPGWGIGLLLSQFFCAGIVTFVWMLIKCENEVMKWLYFTTIFIVIIYNVVIFMAAATLVPTA
jgi:hypothetical protein